MTLPTLNTERLLLRPYRLADIPDLIRLAGAREVAATTLRIPHPYREQDAVDFLASSQAEVAIGACARFAITLRATGEFCGGIGLRIEPAHHNAELGYWLGVPYWDKGYATEAARAVLQYGFETLSLHRVYASHVEQNPASGKVLRKIGMQREGLLRGHICKWDQFHDLEFYGILKAEWDGRAHPSG